MFKLNQSAVGIFTAVSLIAATAFSAIAQEQGQAAKLSKQQNEIKKLTEQFVTAFNKGDAKTIASRWAENGEMNLDGETTKGRAAIEKSYTDFFKENPGLQISINIESIKVLGKGAAIEKGVSEIVNDDDDSVVDSYTLVYTKNNNAWQIVKSDVHQAEVDPFDWKKELRLLVGTWKSGEGDWRVETNFEWATGGNFLKRTFEVFEGDKSQDAGVQIIGWDARVGTVKSWMFHKGGGNGVGVWTRDGNQWVIECESTTADGQLATSTNIFTILGDDNLRWQSTKRAIDGVAIDDTDSIRIKRSK